MIGLDRTYASLPAPAPRERWSPRASFLFIVGFNLLAWGGIAALAKFIIG